MKDLVAAFLLNAGDKHQMQQTQVKNIYRLSGWIEQNYNWKWIESAAYVLNA